MPSFYLKNKNKLSYQSKLALVHDDFTQKGGAENLFATIAFLFPKVPIYTSIVDWRKLPAAIDRERVRPSFMQKIPLAKYIYKILLPFYPLAFESFDFSKYDLVISSTTRFANSIITRPQTIHIAYVNSTPRFLWNKQAQKQYLSKALIFIFKPFLSWLKRWDKAASYRADFYIANSKNVQKGIKKFYFQKSEVVYPFAATSFFRPAKIHNWQLKSKNYFLIVTRLVKWKRVEIAIMALGKLNKNLVIVGEGPDKKRLLRLSSQINSKVEFASRVSLKKLKELYQNCQALIVTQEEDFGISAVEAQSCGRPVIAYSQGGASEIIQEGETGIFFYRQEEDYLKDAILRLSRLKWNEQKIRSNALRFSKSVFVKSFKKLVESYVQESTRS